MQEVFEKIIEKLESLEKVFIKGNSHNVAAGISRAIEIVKQAAEQYTSTEHINCSSDSSTNGWIPCSDELPPHPKENPILENRPIEMYLVSVSCYGYPIRAFWNGRFFTDGWNKLDVDAWQPLPESYQQKGE